MRFKTLLALALFACATFAPTVHADDGDAFTVTVFEFAGDPDGLLAGEILVERVGALPFESPYSSHVRVLEFLPDHQGRLRMRAMPDDGNEYIATVATFAVAEDGLLMLNAMLLGVGQGGNPDVTAPAAPTGLALVRGTNSIALDWNDNAEPDLAGYKIYRSDGVSPVSFNLVATIGATSAHDDETVTSTPDDGFYRYRVTAFDSAGNESAASSIVNTPPNAVTDLAAEAGDGQATLTWTGGTANGTNTYDLYLSTNGVDFSEFSTGVTSPHAATGLSNGTAYHFRLLQNGTSATIESNIAGPTTPASAELDIPAMDDLVALFRPVDDEVNESETSAGQVFWADASATGGNDALVVSSSANPTYTSGESLNFVSSDTLNFASALDSGEFDIFLTCKFTGAGAFYFLYKNSTQYARLAQSTGTVTCRLLGTGSQALWNNSVDGVSLPIDEWILVRLRRDSASAVSLWINGTLISQKTFSPTAETLEGTSLVNTGSSVSIGHICIFNVNVAETPAGELTDALMAAYGIE